jgi:hypothetical protein
MKLKTSVQSPKSNVQCHFRKPWTLDLGPWTLSLLILTSSIAHAETVKKPAVVPEEFQWKRSLDVEGFVARENGHKTGIQHLRARLRYLDPDVNAFIGMQGSVDHFNRELALEDPANARRGDFLGDLGANIGIVRGTHLWEIDLQGVTAAGKLGFGPAFAGEHQLGHPWIFYHRMQADLFAGDGIWDADGGFYWKMTNRWQLSLGYRWFTSLHLDRSGPHIGLRYYFESPKIPFIFPAVGS